MSCVPKPSFDRACLSELARGAEKTFENAEALFREAKLLGSVGAAGRALFLHQISLEECAKIEIIGALATSLLAGIAVDQNKVLARLGSHARKNRTNAYFLERSAEEQAAQARGDWEAALAGFKRLQTQFHAKSNDAKNASLYVDFEDGKFVAPIERITDVMLAKTAARNETFLGLTYPKLQMLLKWTKEPEEAQRRVIAFMKLLGRTIDQGPKETMLAIDKLINDFVKAEAAEHTREPIGD
jgi:AbiV family abortive infection protein